MCLSWPEAFLHVNPPITDDDGRFRLAHVAGITNTYEKGLIRSHYTISVHQSTPTQYSLLKNRWENGGEVREGTSWVT